MTMQVLALAPGFVGVVAHGVGSIVLYALLGLVLLLLGFYAIDLTTPGKLSQLVRSGHPNAVAVTAAGLVGMAFVVVTAIYGSVGQLAEGLLSTLIFGLLGVIVQAVAARLLEWVTGIDIGAVLADEQVRPETRVVCAAHLALGLIVAVAVF
jgi:uncharacterized membrane protein YjfL (UPF0719 family)